MFDFQVASESTTKSESATQMRLRQSVAVLIWILALLIALDLPSGKWVALMGMACLVLIILYRPVLVFAALPTLVAAHDLTPWTGRWLVNEWDCWMLTAVATAIWLTPLNRRRRLGRRERSLLKLMCLVFGVSLLTSMSELMSSAQPVSFYDSPWNAIRIGKGVIYGFAIFLLIRASSLSANNIIKLFGLGCISGILLTSGSVLLERLRFFGDLSLGHKFRSVGPFAEMHTGGAYIDAYLVASLPFLLVIWPKSRKAAQALLVAVLFISLYSVLATLSRAPMVVLALQFIVLTAYLLTQRTKHVRRLVVVSVCLSLMAAWTAFSTDRIRDRFSTITEDTQTRFDHWHQVLASPDRGFLRTVFGFGAGRFVPVHRTTDTERTDVCQVISDQGGNFLRIRGSKTFYLDQIVKLQPNTDYEFKVVARSVAGGQTGLNLTVCEKNMLYSFRKARLEPMLLDSQPGKWTKQSVRFHSDDVGQSNFGWIFLKPIVVASLSPVGDSVVDVANIELLDPSGDNLIQNGDFSQGHDRWWWTSDRHLLWHAQNIWVHLLIELGLLGTLCILAASCYGVLSTFKSNQIDMKAKVALLTSFGSLMAIGLIDSVVDSPRLIFFVTNQLLIMLMHSAATVPNSTQ